MKVRTMKGKGKIESQFGRRGWAVAEGNQCTDWHWID